MIYVLLVVVLGVSLALALTRPRSGATFALGGGLALIYMGERLFAGDDMAWLATAVGVVEALAALGLRARALGAADAAEGPAQRTALIHEAIALGSLLLYALTTDAATDALGLTGEAYSRWTVTLTALWPVVLLAGLIPAALVDGVLEAHPVRMPAGAHAHAVRSGLVLAFGLTLVFPVNYLANEHDVASDQSYFRVTEPGSSTKAIVASLAEPVEVLLFYPPANEVKEKLLPYFEQIAGLSDGRLTVRVVDQPMEPALSEELKVRDNGYVVVRQGDKDRKFRIDDDEKRAKRDLKRLDGTFQKNLLALATAKKTIYFLVGHEEATPRDEDDLLKLAGFKKLVESQNYDVEDFGLVQGSADAVPDDAAFVVLAAPARALLPEETAALKTYVDGGGSLLIYGDVGREPLTDLMGHLGLRFTDGAVAHASEILPVTRSVQDRYALYSNRFGSHASTATLTKFSTRASIAAITALGIDQTGDPGLPGKPEYTPLIRSYDGSWVDSTRDFKKGEGEAEGVQVLAMAVESPEPDGYRAIVVGDVSMASDFVLSRSQGSAQFVLDGARWLAHEEDLTGEISSEEDVRIKHTKEDDAMWFYATIFGMPVLLLVVGAFVVRRRRTTA